MNYLLARVRDRKTGMRCLISNMRIYDIPGDTISAVPYSPEDSLEEDEWFFLDNFKNK